MNDDLTAGPNAESNERRLERRRVDQDRTLFAMQELEAVLGQPSPGRERAWRETLVEALTVLHEAAALEAENAARPDSLLSDLAQHQPRLRNRVRGLRIQYRQLHDAIGSLRRELEETEDTQQLGEVADVRHRLATILTGLRQLRAKESDLLYEAYYDAFRSDLPRDVERELGS
jgi:hypothetical protein